MEKLDFLKGIIDQNLLDEFVKASEKDIVLKKAIEKSTDIKSFVDALLASIICVVAREEYFAKEISTFVNSHPDITQAIMSKKFKDSMTTESNGND